MLNSKGVNWTQNLKLISISPELDQVFKIWHVTYVKRLKSWHFNASISLEQNMKELWVKHG